MILYNMEEIYQPTYEERHSCQHSNTLIKKMQYFLMQTYTITEESQLRKLYFLKKLTMSLAYCFDSRFHYKVYVHVDTDAEASRTMSFNSFANLE